jgi:hypothetical protein
MRECTGWYNLDHLNWVYEIEAAEAGMRVSDKVLKCVVFIGVEKPGGFEPVGTGFVVMVPQGQVGFQYVVTAQHVLDGLREPISIRVNRKNGEAEPIKPPFGWYYHPDNSRFVDVAVAPILLQLDTYDVIHIKMKDFCDLQFLLERDVGVGDELFYPSLFMHRRGLHRNHPVMRFGELAAMPLEPVITRSGPILAYLMEGRSIGGHSGAPVFINFLAPRTYYSDQVVQLPHPNQAQGYRLLGLIRGFLKAKDTGEYITDDPKAEDLWINSGISTIIPTSEIFETLMQDDLVQQRNEHAKRVIDGLADVPASARPASDSKPLDGDANPNHLADFTRLVDVAARKRPQDD